jgi:hypothetical protein
VKSPSTSTRRSATNSAHSACPCFEKVQEHYLPPQEIRAHVQRYLAALADKARRVPTTLAADDSGGGLSAKITFERVIVFPDGHREIEGVTPKQLPARSSHVLPSTDVEPVQSIDSVDN